MVITSLVEVLHPIPGYCLQARCSIASMVLWWCRDFQQGISADAHVEYPLFCLKHKLLQRFCQASRGVCGGGLKE